MCFFLKWSRKCPLAASFCIWYYDFHNPCLDFNLTQFPLLKRVIYIFFDVSSSFPVLIQEHEIKSRLQGKEKWRGAIFSVSGSLSNWLLALFCGWVVRRSVRCKDCRGHSPPPPPAGKQKNHRVELPGTFGDPHPRYCNKVIGQLFRLFVFWAGSKQVVATLPW